MCDRLVKYSEAVAVLTPRVGSRDGAKRLLRENRVVPCVPPERHGLHGQKLWMVGGAPWGGMPPVSSRKMLAR